MFCMLRVCMEMEILVRPFLIKFEWIYIDPLHQKNINVTVAKGQKNTVSALLTLPDTCLRKAITLKNKPIIYDLLYSLCSNGFIMS